MTVSNANLSYFDLLAVLRSFIFSSLLKINFSTKRKKKIQSQYIAEPCSLLLYVRNKPEILTELTLFARCFRSFSKVFFSLFRTWFLFFNFLFSQISLECVCVCVAWLISLLPINKIVRFLFFFAMTKQVQNTQHY